MPISEVRFSASKSGEVSLLEISTNGRRSMLDRVRALLYRLRIDILRVESIVREEGIVETFEIVENDGRAISRRRAATVRSALRKALRGGRAAA
jgi:UTP:GlnB (protein PII) uridylyltransferase